MAFSFNISERVGGASNIAELEAVDGFTFEEGYICFLIVGGWVIRESGLTMIVEKVA